MLHNDHLNSSARPPHLLAVGSWHNRYSIRAGVVPGQEPSIELGMTSYLGQSSLYLSKLRLSQIFEIHPFDLGSKRGMKLFHREPLRRRLLDDARHFSKISCLN